MALLRRAVDAFGGRYGDADGPSADITAVPGRSAIAATIGRAVFGSGKR
jgi:hypothetical protein